jgi:hypothetical protein
MILAHGITKTKTKRQRTKNKNRLKGQAEIKETFKRKIMTRNPIKN